MFGMTLSLIGQMLVGTIRGVSAPLSFTLPHKEVNVIYSLYINGTKAHSFRTFCQALAYCQYHNIYRAKIKMAGCIIATIHNGETV